MENIQGVCKDCGTGTLNNKRNPVFVADDNDVLVCNRCGSTHIDVIGTYSEPELDPYTGSLEEELRNQIAEEGDSL